MSQRFLVANVSKHEVLDIGDPAGLPLMSMVWLDSFPSRALLTLMNEEWKGDKVCLLGEYASLTKSFRFDNSDKFIFGFADEFSPKWLSSPYEYARLAYTPKILYKRDLVKFGYIYNVKTNQRIELRECFVSEFDGNRMFVINPLMLLLAAGNGLGSGDYGYLVTGSSNFVGDWLDSSTGVYTSKACLYSGFRLFSPDFAEFSHKYQRDCKSR